MDKVIPAAITPGKTYVIKFKPSNSDVWSNAYEFNAPRPTTAALRAAIDSSANATKNRIFCQVRRTVDLTVNGPQTIPFSSNGVVQNDYEMWKSTNPDRITCPVAGWYQASITLYWQSASGSTTGNVVLYHGLDVYHGPSHPTKPAQSENLVIESRRWNPTEAGPVRLTLVSLPVYCDDGDYFTVSVDSGRSSAPWPVLAGGAANQQDMSVLYLGP